MRRVGVLMSTNMDADQQACVSVFVQTLQQLGWTNSRNVRIDIRWAGGDPTEIRRHAEHLVAQASDVLVASGNAGMPALMRATSTLPIVFVQVTDPVGAGYVDSIAVPGANATRGDETGMFEVPAGGRRYRALELLVKQKRLNKTQLVPCIVRMDGIAEEDSLAENVQRAPLHPLDQFRAFQALRVKGLGEENIAARFFVHPAVVKQRLKLAAVSQKLLDVYAEDGMTLEQLMAFTVTNDQVRQEQVWEALARTYLSAARTAPSVTGGGCVGSRYKLEDVQTAMAFWKSED
jgi:hypothetical protein